VLAELAYGPARSNADLARASFVTPQTMNEILLSLERRGLVVRTPQPEGGRAMLAELTREGGRKVLSFHLAMRRVGERLLGALSAEDVSRLRQSRKIFGTFFAVLTYPSPWIRYCRIFGMRSGC
jgi:DNA-binding MarR family transcriptional regulator